MTRIRPAIVTQWREPPTRQRYESRDTILYHLGLGAGRLGMDEALPYVWEDRLVALPSFAAALAPQRPWMLDPGSTIDSSAMVHGEQFLTLHRPLPVAGDVVGRVVEQQLWDNGPGRGAVLDMVRTLCLADAPDHPLAMIRSVIILRGDGGFGGTRRPAAPVLPLPEREPDVEATLATAIDQALLYRQSGDRHALHVFPDYARAAGFERPILHGLATYGLACLLVTHHRCGDDPARIARFDARFAAPVYPGDVLRLRLWMREDGLSADFRCHVGDRLVLDRGFVEFRS